MKTCPDCGIEKPDCEYHRRANGKANTYCKPCACARARENRRQNLERAKAVRLAYYERNREAIIEKHRRYRLRDPEKTKLQRKREYAQGRERIIARAAAYNKANPLKQAEVVRRRRARIAGSRTEPVSYRAILERDGTTCYLCEQEIPEGELVFDHVVPISRGGAHVAGNIRPTHRSCNARKSDRLPEEYLQALERQAA